MERFRTANGSGGEACCLGKPLGSFAEQRWTSESLGLTFPGTAALSSQGLAEAIASKPGQNGKAAAWLLPGAQLSPLVVGSVSGLAEQGTAGANRGTLHIPSRWRRNKRECSLP